MPIQTKTKLTQSAEVKTLLTVNGTKHSLISDSSRSLLSVLREDLDLTGAKYGCGEGQCGACTVLLDGKPVRSCITQIGNVGARAVTTVEGLERSGKLHPLQQAFLDEDALQCGYCTPGMIMSALALLKRKPNPTVEEIKTAMQGNLCRCGTYARIVKAIRRAAKETAK